MQAVKCLDSHTISDVYTLSLLAYTYTLMDRNGRRRRVVMDILEHLTISNGDFMFVIHMCFFAKKFHRENIFH